MSDAADSTDSGGDVSRSLCAVFAILIEEQLESDNPDMGVVQDNLDRTKKHCSTMPTPAGETPEQLEQYQYESEN